MAEVTSIGETNISVKLLEYDNIEGMVLIADASMRKKRKSLCLMKQNKKYCLAVTEVDKNKKFITLSYKYVTSEQRPIKKKEYKNWLIILKMFKKYLSNLKDGKFEEEFYSEQIDKTLWKVKPNDCYSYLVNFYLNKNNLELFDIDDENKKQLKLLLTDMFGKLEIITKFMFGIRNPNYEGVNKIKELFSKIDEDYGLDIMINNIPEYYVVVKSNKEQKNNELIDQIDNYMENFSNKNKFLYKNISIETKVNI